MNRSRFRTGLCVAILVAGAGGTGAALGQSPIAPAAQPTKPATPAPTPAPTPEALPDGKAVIAKSIEATGGREAFEKIKSSVTTGSFEVPAQNMKAAMKVEQSGDKMRITIDLPGMGLMQMGTDGKNVWATDPMQGPRVLSGAERDAFVRQATRNADFRLDDFFTSVKTVATEDIDGKPAYKIELAPKTGKPEHRWYDKASSLLVKTESVQTSPMGELKSTTTMSDYRDFGAVKLPCIASIKVMGFEQRLTTEKVEQNVEVPDERFLPPEDVKKLMEKQPG